MENSLSYKLQNKNDKCYTDLRCKNVENSFSINNSTLRKSNKDLEIASTSSESISFWIVVILPLLFRKTRCTDPVLDSASRA